MTDELEKKVRQSVSLIQKAVGDKVVEVAYSGGKDSDVILELTKMAGVKYRAIYKNTTIDPVDTVKHCKEKGCEIVRPKNGITFFKLVEQKGFPNRHRRFCCEHLKEYKILDMSIIGVRKSESKKRAKRYQEPIECRFYGSKKKHAQAIYPILDWSDENVVEFIKWRGIKCHPLYYDEQGNFHVERRLGCVGCPLVSKKNRKQQFKENKGMLKAWLLWGGRSLMRRSLKNKNLFFADVYEWFTFELFYENSDDFKNSKQSIFGDSIDYRKFIEDYFGVDLSWVDARLEMERKQFLESNKTKLNNSEII